MQSASEMHSGAPPPVVPLSDPLLSAVPIDVDPVVGSSVVEDPGPDAVADSVAVDGSVVGPVPWESVAESAVVTALVLGVAVSPSVPAADEAPSVPLALDCGTPSSEQPTSNVPAAIQGLKSNQRMSGW